MKRLVLVVLSIFMMSCNITNEFYDNYYESEMEGHNLYYSEAFESLGTIEDVSRYVADSIIYKESRGYQNPEQTLSDRLGNCTSYAIAYINVLYYVTGIKANVIIVDHSTRSVVNGGTSGDHAIVELQDGTQIEPQDGQLRQYEVLYRYSFDDVF